MKIALINNMNNNFFATTRYLRDLGYDAELLLIDEEFEHFLPANDSYTDEYKQYTRQLNWGGVKKYYLTTKSKIKNDLKEYDFIICCGLIPAYLAKCDIKIDLIVPYGFDIYNLPFLFKNFKKNVKSILFEIYKVLIINQQIRGINNASNVMMGSFTYTKILNTIRKNKDAINAFVPMVYVVEYLNLDKNKILNQSTLKQKFNKTGTKTDLILFHHGRILWKNSPNDPSYKGTDIFLEGLKLLKENNNINFKVVFYEYGNDVDITKLFLKENNLEENIIWLPKSSRKNIMIEMYYSDIVISQFHHSNIVSGVNYEALTMGKMILQHLNLNEFNIDENEIYPYLEASTPVEVSEQIVKYNNNKEFYKEKAQEAHNWFIEHLINKPLNTIVELIDEKQRRINTTK